MLGKNEHPNGIALSRSELKALALFREDYKKSIHVREIARRVGVDPSTILQHLQKLVDLNVLTYSLAPKGKNKEYSLNLESLSTKYCMAEAEINTTFNFLQHNYLISKVLSELGNDLDGITLLFGSYAKGTATAKSDIDLFLISGRKVSESLIGEVSRTIGKDINIERATKNRFMESFSSNEPLTREVVGNHIILKGFDGFCDMMWHYFGGR
ncbi:MAG TPA: nucleotidyltransferase domain-containing protein [Nitrososphaerales archaeon]|nr:nucleotidyltransferase domain-containing protein [Nitrososphaerales archaeon]